MPSLKSIKISYCSPPPVPPPPPPCHDEPSPPPPPPPSPHPPCSPCQHKYHTPPPPPAGAAPPPPPLVSVPPPPPPPPVSVPPPPPPVSVSPPPPPVYVPPPPVLSSPPPLPRPSPFVAATPTPSIAPSPPPSQNTNVPPEVIGPTLGALVFLAFVALALNMLTKKITVKKPSNIKVDAGNTSTADVPSDAPGPGGREIHLPEKAVMPSSSPVEKPGDPPPLHDVRNEEILRSERLPHETDGGGEEEEPTEDDDKSRKRKRKKESSSASLITARLKEIKIGLEELVRDGKRYDEEESAVADSRPAHSAKQEMEEDDDGDEGRTSQIIDPEQPVEEKEDADEAEIVTEEEEKSVADSGETERPAGKPHSKRSGKKAEANRSKEMAEDDDDEGTTTSQFIENIKVEERVDEKLEDVVNDSNKTEDQETSSKAGDATMKKSSAGAGSAKRHNTVTSGLKQIVKPIIKCLTTKEPKNWSNEANNLAEESIKLIKQLKGMKENETEMENDDDQNEIEGITRYAEEHKNQTDDMNMNIKKELSTPSREILSGKVGKPAADLNRSTKRDSTKTQLQQPKATTTIGEAVRSRGALMMELGDKEDNRNEGVKQSLSVKKPKALTSMDVDVADEEEEDQSASTGEVSQLTVL